MSWRKGGIYRNGEVATEKGCTDDWKYVDFMFSVNLCYLQDFVILGPRVRRNSKDVEQNLRLYISQQSRK